MTTTKMSDTEILRADLEMTRQHLADTVQQLSRQLNFPRRIKESATDAGQRATTASRQHPRTTAAIGGSVALGAGAAAWAVLRNK